MIVPTSKAYEDKVSLYKALRPESNPNSFSSPLHFNILDPFYPQYFLILKRFVKTYLAPKTDLLLFSYHLWPSTWALLYQDADRCPSLKDYHFIPGPQVWNLFDIKRMGVTEYSGHLLISLHLFLWELSLPGDSGVLGEGLMTQYRSRRLNRERRQSGGTQLEMLTNGRRAPELPQSCPYWALEFQEFLQSCELLSIY